MAESDEHDPDKMHALPEGAAVSGYVIRRMLGRGGFGITYAAENPVTGRQFAIKEFFPLGMAWRDGRSRLVHSKAHAETIEWALKKFRETTTTLCGLSHPNIVQVHDYVPANDTGYMVMELLHGQTLKDWLKARSHPPSWAELRPHVDPVMEALAYVHGRGLIHRDIAPDNILLVREGRPVLIDFGSVSRDLSDAQSQAMSGTIGLSKRHFTAPEQMRAKARPTPEADVYSMAAVVYYALTGSEPADGQERVDALFHEQQADPYSPLAARPPSGCPMRAAEAIDKALAMRPDARFRTMAGLLEQLEGRPSEAKPEMDGLVATVVPVVERMARAEDVNVDAGAEPARHGQEPRRTRRWVLGGIGGGALAAGAAAVLVPREKQAGDEAARRAAEQKALAERRAHEETEHNAAEQKALAEKQAQEAERRAAEAKTRPLLTFTGHTSYVNAVAIAPDGRTALSGSDDKTLKLWNLDSGRHLRTFTGHTGAVRSVAIAPDGRTALSGSEDTTLKLWDLESGRELRTFTGHFISVRSVAIAPDGQTALSRSGDQTLKLWDLASGRVLRTFTELVGGMESAAFTPDGRTALSGSENATVKLWDLASGRVLPTLTVEDAGAATYFVLAPDGRTALSDRSIETFELWDLSSGRDLRIFSGHTHWVYSVAFAPDGRTALSGSQDKTLKLWDLASGRTLRTFIGHTASVASVAIAPDGRTALSGSGDNTLKLWDLTDA